MVAASPARSRVPRFVPFFNPLALWLLRRGRLMGPNTLLTVRGRKSGKLRRTPVAVVEIQGKRWIIGTFGETNWVRNLRAAGEGVLSAGDLQVPVRARELTREETVAFFIDVLKPYVKRLPVGWLLLRILGAREIVEDPLEAAAKRPVFELEPGGLGRES